MLRYLKIHRDYFWDGTLSPLGLILLWYLKVHQDYFWDGTLSPLGLILFWYLKVHQDYFLMSFRLSVILLFHSVVK